MIIGVFFVGCSKNYSEEISFFNYRENIDEETIKEFEKQYGIKVNVETFDDMETMYQKVSNSGVTYDVILVSDALMPRIIKNNLVQELNKENIPNISQMDEEYLNLDIDPVYGVDNGTTMILTGESDINMIWSGEGLNLQDEYPNLTYVVPKEGANFWIDSLCIPYNAKNVSGAEKFINFVSDKESALRIADEIGYTTPNKEARLEQPEEVRNNPNVYMTKEIMDRCEIYVDLPKNVKKIYDNVWIEIKSSN